MAKPRRLITRRRIKWAGAIASIVIASFWIGFASAVYVYYRATPNHEIVAGIGDGRLFATSVERRPPQDLFVESEITQGFRATHGFSMQLSFTFDFDMSDGVGVIAVPLWFPLLLVLVPTVYLWRSGRLQPWQCRGCRYDLRGLEGGGEKAVCPECGLAIGEG